MPMGMGIGLCDWSAGGKAVEDYRNPNAGASFVWPGWGSVVRFSWEVLLWEAEGEIAVAEDGAVVEIGGGDFPEMFGEGAEFFGFVRGAGGGVTAGAVAKFGGVWGRGMAVGPGFVFSLIGDVFAHAVGGVAIDAFF